MKQTMQAPEEMPGLRVEQLDPHELGAYGSKIRALKYNVLDPKLNNSNEGSLGQRRQDLGEIKASIHAPGEHDVLYVAKDGEDVVGFLAIEKTPEGKIASIRQLWTYLPEARQRAIAGRLIDAAKGYLTSRGYPRLQAEKMSSASNFSIIAATPERGRYLNITRSDMETEPVGFSLTGEVFETPEVDDVANDNEPEVSLEKAA